MKPARFVAALAATALLGSAAFAGSDPLGHKKPEFLPVEQAFELQPLVRKPDGTLEVSWRIAREYYLYRDKLKFTASSPASLKLGKAALPVSLPHEDEHFGTTQIYRDRLVITLPLSADAKGPVSITVVYQGCADAGLCYPMQTRTLGTGS